MANADEKKQQKAKTDSPAAAKQENDVTEIDLVALFYRLLEKFHWILLTALVGAGIALVIVLKFITPMYQATAKIYIVGSDTTISLSDLQIGSNLAADYQEVFKNWHVHELVDKRLNLNYSYTKLAGMISVTNPSNTHVLYVSAKSPDPVEAKTLADAYAQVAREFIATKMDMREPNIFEEAMLPSKPVSPQKTRDVIIGFLIGALLAAAIVTIKFLSDDRILSSEDIEKVGNLATLGMIPLQDIGEEEEGKKGHKKKNKGSTGGKE
jgi:capsular polysaccharide biosynthesis protein